MLYATGLTPGDMSKAQVGIASMWYEGNSCNMHLDELAAHTKQGVTEAGLVGMRFNTIGVSDGMSMGTDGMSYSLQSRDLIADSIETVMSAQWYDANISIPGCDKNMPGAVMAMARLDRPALMIYGGTIRAGVNRHGNPIDIVSAFQSYGEAIAGRLSEDDRLDVVLNACPGAGACGGMYTANTMAVAIEAMGMSLPYSSSTPATDPGKAAECRAAGAAIRRLLEKDIRPGQIMTRAAFENAMVITMVLGGSTNAVLHLMAMAHSAGVDLDIEDFQPVSDRIPYLGDLKPSGRYVMEDLHEVGGTPAVLRMLLERGAIDGDCLTVTGRTMAENLADVPGLAEGQLVIAPWDNPVKDSGHIQILRGNLAPEGAVAKITGKEGLSFTGTALPYDSEEDMLSALERGEIGPGIGDHHPLRRPEGRAGHARDAHPHLGHHGRRSGPGRRPHHRRPLLGRLARFHHGPCLPRSPGGRPDRAGGTRGSDLDRRGGPDHHPRRIRGRVGRPSGGLDASAAQGHPGHPGQVHPDGVDSKHRMRDRRLKV